MSREAIIARIESLPEASQKQLLAFLNFLSAQTDAAAATSKPAGFKFDWAGGLTGLEFTAVELQHKANEWR